MSDLRGVQLLRKAVNHIVKNPSEYNQDSWHCGSTRCVGGWCQHYSGSQVIYSDWTGTGKLLGLDEETYDWLFDSYRSFHEIYKFTQQWLESGTIPDIDKIASLKEL